MRVFVTGATGFVGSAVVRELLDAGHSVVGLARSEASAASLRSIGAEVQHGSLDDLESLRVGAAASDGVIHTAFIHDFSKFKDNCETDRRVVDALGSALAGSQRPLLVTSGTAVAAQGRLAVEADIVSSKSTPNPRVASEEAVALLAERGIRASIVRLPPSVHGEGDHGFIPILINIARQKGVSAFVAEGLNRWPAVHQLDAARLYRLALEKGTEATRYHSNAEEGVAFKNIAEVIGRRLNVPVVSLSKAEAHDHFGWFEHFAALDNPTSGQWTRKLLDWKPQRQGLLEDIDQASYYR